MAQFQKHSRRRHHRFDRPQIFVAVNGFDGHSHNWSLGGIAVAFPEEATAEFPVDSEIEGHVGPIDDAIRHQFTGRVVRVDGKDSLMAMQFADLSQGAVMMFIQEFRQMIGGAA